MVLISFLQLIVPSRTFNSTLTRCGQSGKPLVSDARKYLVLYSYIWFQFFTIMYDFSCKFFLDVLHQVNFYFYYSKSFYSFFGQELLLKFLLFWDGFYFSVFNIVNYMDWFLKVCIPWKTPLSHYIIVLLNISTSKPRQYWHLELDGSLSGADLCIVKYLAASLASTQ